MLLRDRFTTKRYGMIAASGNLLACALVFESKSPELGHQRALGGLFFDPDIADADVHAFARKIREGTGAIDLAPVNGHINLGLSLPEANVKAGDITFLCAPVSPKASEFFRGSGVFTPSGRWLAMTMPIGAFSKERTPEAFPPGFSSRPISKWNFKRDIGIYSALANASMEGHPHFYPLTAEEDWDLLRDARPGLVSAWFRFLLYRGKEVGFCYGLPDYNEVLSNEKSDVRNALKLVRTKWLGKFTRARIVYMGIKPEFRGKGLLKVARAPVLASMAKHGILEVETSYIADDNSASIGSITALGGKISHGFTLFRSL